MIKLDVKPSYSFHKLVFLLENKEDQNQKILSDAFCRPHYSRRHAPTGVRPRHNLNSYNINPLTQSHYQEGRRGEKRRGKREEKRRKGRKGRNCLSSQ
jgi:hypothetical protein